MTKIAFFFDTANVDYIRNAWEKMNSTFTADDLVGITTNPNAMAKEGANVSLEAHLQQTKALAELLFEIKKDDNGLLYVQVPNSQMPLNDALRFAKLHKEAVKGKCKLGLKISPNPEYLNNIHLFNQLDLAPNVTGLADSGTALLCLGYDVRYISIIPGRMEEKGLDATSHLLFLKSRKLTGNEVIAGSMRTLDGLERAIIAGTVPTIGTRVFDQILSDDVTIKRFKAMWSKEELINKKIFNQITPVQNDTTKKLSLDFFNQMDKLGLPLYEDFKKTFRK